MSSRPAGADIFLRNRWLGRTPIENRAINAFDESMVEARMRGYEPQRKALVWGDGYKATVAFRLTETR